MFQQGRYWGVSQLSLLPPFGATWKCPFRCFVACQTSRRPRQNEGSFDSFVSVSVITDLETVPCHDANFVLLLELFKEGKQI